MKNAISKALSMADAIIETAAVASVFYGVHRIYEPAAFIVLGAFGVWLTESGEK